MNKKQNIYEGKRGSVAQNNPFMQQSKGGIETK